MWRSPTSLQFLSTKMSLPSSQYRILRDMSTRSGPSSRWCGAAHAPGRSARLERSLVSGECAFLQMTDGAPVDEELDDSQV